MNLLEFLKDATDYVNQGSPVDVIYLDFQKAFDKVPHQRLFKKVQALGIV
jgi:ribonuclease P/MRP protein subunit RPP40